MPFCYVSSYQAAGDAGIKIFYRTYGGGPNKVLMIIGLAGTHDSWLPQIKGLTSTVEPNDDQLGGFDRDAAEVGGDGNDAGDGVEVCAFDNRGMGRSSVPTKKSEYTTTTMAKDAIALMDHLGWRKAHVFGHSMGAMIACKFAALVPDRVLSLALLNVTGGGYQCFPKIDRQTLSIAIRFLRAKTPEQRAAVDLDTHYSKEYLEEYVGPNKRRALLYQEYVKGISASGMQSNYGFAGQINACWMHKMSLKEIESIRSAGFLISVIHGRHDVIAQLYHAKRLAEKLHPFARMVELHGGHLVSHERTEEVNQALLELIEASETKISPYDWANLPTQSSENLNGMATQTGSLSPTQQPSLTLIVNESTLVGGPTMIHGPFGSKKRLSLNLHNGQMKSTLSSKKLRPSLGLLSAVTGWTVTRISFGSTMVDTLDKLRLLLLYFFGLFVLVFEYLQRGLRRLKPVRVGPALT